MNRFDTFAALVAGYGLVFCSIVLVDGWIEGKRFHIMPPLFAVLFLIACSLVVVIYLIVRHEYKKGESKPSAGTGKSTTKEN